MAHPQSLDADIVHTLSALRGQTFVTVIDQKQERFARCILASLIMENPRTIPPHADRMVATFHGSKMGEESYPTLRDPITIQRPQSYIFSLGFRSIEHPFPGFFACHDVVVHRFTRQIPHPLSGSRPLASYTGGASGTETYIYTTTWLIEVEEA